MEVNVIDLPKLSIIEEVSFSAYKEKLIKFIASIDDTIYLPESSKEMALLEAFAYDLAFRDASLNERMRQILPTLSYGENLDTVCKSFYGTTRLENESDENFLTRSLYSLQQPSTAGAEWTYVFHTKNVDSRIIDVLPYRTGGSGEVTVVWHTMTTDPEEIALLSDGIVTALNNPKIRPLCDTVIVKKADLVSFDVNAVLRILPNVDGNMIISNATSLLNDFLNGMRIGQEVRLSKISALLHVDGVDNISFVSPPDDIIISKEEVAVCGNISLVTEVVEDE